MDMDSAYRGLGWCMGVFAIMMFAVGHILSGDGTEGFAAMQAQDNCNSNKAIIGVTIKAKLKDLHYVCK
jgi:hypothetical protein